MTREEKIKVYLTEKEWAAIQFFKQMRRVPAVKMARAQLAIQLNANNSIMREFKTEDKKEHFVFMYFNSNEIKLINQLMKLNNLTASEIVRGLTLSYCMQ